MTQKDGGNGWGCPFRQRRECSWRSDWIRGERWNALTSTHRGEAAPIQRVGVNPLHRLRIVSAQNCSAMETALSRADALLMVS